MLCSCILTAFSPLGEISVRSSEEGFIVLVQCGGANTEGAVDQLQRAGYTVHEIEGGFPEWTKVYNPKGEPRQAAAAR